jgi:hypothetical protein
MTAAFGADAARIGKTRAMSGMRGYERSVRVAFSVPRNGKVGFSSAFSYRDHSSLNSRHREEDDVKKGQFLQFCALGRLRRSYPLVQSPNGPRPLKTPLPARPALTILDFKPAMDDLMTMRRIERCRRRLRSTSCAAHLPA